MITAGMELLNFIDPTLTWKTVFKGKRTSRHSRRPVSKFLKSDKDQGKKDHHKRSSGTDSDKSDLSVQEQGFGNMKHMPIKKRRFFLRSPSPTPQSPNHDDSQELDSGPCTFDPQTFSNENAEQDVSGNSFSKPVLKKCGIDNGLVENTASSCSEVVVSSEDFSGIAILASVAACSDEIDCTVGDIEESKMSDLSKIKYDESFTSMTDMKENIISGLSDCLGMTPGQLMVDECVADFPCNSVLNDCLKNVTEISELSRIETNESDLSAINRAESIECRGSSDLTDKSIKISGAPKKSRLHWDLNILMEEWGRPIDDTFDDSCMESVAVASTSAMSFQKPENVDPSTLTSLERPLAVESVDQFNAQSVTCSMPNNNLVTDTKFIKVTGEGLQSTLKTKVPENNSSLVALSMNDACDVKGVHRGHSDSKERDVLDENRKGSGIICRPVSTNSEPLKYKNSLDTTEDKYLDTLSLPTNSEVSMVELRDSDDSSTSDASRFDRLMEVVPNVTEALMQVIPTSNNANVASVEHGYDSYLEDGELRESIRHCWEDDEDEDAEIEHVDYDSDNEDIQLSGEVLSGDGEEQNYHLEKCGPCLDNSVVENCSLQHQNCLLTVDAKVSGNVKMSSPMLKACCGTHLRMKDRVEGDSKDSGRSDLETDRSGNDYDTYRNCRGVSSGGSSNSIRSSNFDDMHQTDCSGESVTGCQAPLKRTDGCISRSGNVELKSVVPDSLPEGGERVVGVSEDNTPTSICRPHIISTSRSINNPISESTGERNNGRGRGAVKEGDFTMGPSSCYKFDRSRNGSNRGFGEGYNRPVYEGGRTNVPMVNHFENRMDSHFPQTHRKFSSRSRTRSPDFRTDTRMGQARSPYQPPGLIRERRSPVKSFNQRQRFDTMGSVGRLISDDCPRPMLRPARFNNTTSSRDPDCEENYHYRKKPFVMHGNKRSPSRSRSYSPDFRPDYRMGAVPGPFQSREGRARERRSPMRVFKPDQKYDNGDQPSLRTGRFNDTSHPATRNEYNNGGDEYRRNSRNIFERIHPRSQYDEQDNRGGRNSRGNGNYVRGGGRCGRGGGGRGGAGNIRYNNNNNNSNSDKTMFSGPKQFEGGMRDYAEHLLPSGVTGVRP